MVMQCRTVVVHSYGVMPHHMFTRNALAHDNLKESCKENGIRCKDFYGYDTIHRKEKKEISKNPLFDYRYLPNTKKNI